jgi:hypothetical protein
LEEAGLDVVASAAAAAVDVAKGPSSTEVFHEANSSASSSAIWCTALIGKRDKGQHAQTFTLTDNDLHWYIVL